MSKLSVNLNKVALLRNARTSGVPDLIEAVEISLAAGAHGITLHPRPDQRHIRFDDLYEVSSFMRKKFPHAELNIEGNPFVKEGRYMELVEEICPDQCTLVPDTPGQRTSDHGWDLPKDRERLELPISRLKEKGIRLSLFMDPLPKQIKEAAGLGIDRIELYTESYACSYNSPDREKVLREYKASARLAQDMGLGLNAGHDLNRQNLGFFLRAAPKVLEVSIGHALIAEALFIGLEQSVKAYLACLPDSPSL